MDLVLQRSYILQCWHWLPFAVCCLCSAAHFVHPHKPKTDTLSSFDSACPGFLPSWSIIIVQLAITLHREQYLNFIRMSSLKKAEDPLIFSVSNVSFLIFSEYLPMSIAMCLLIHCTSFLLHPNLYLMQILLEWLKFFSNHRKKKKKKSYSVFRWFLRKNIFP